ncbi:MAG: SurA N-terminal domain-containing protein [Propylenella sp.]
MPQRLPPLFFRVRRAFALAALLLPALAMPAFAQSAIKILVNDQPITSYDIQQRTAMVRAFTRGQQGEKAAIEQLIDERLMLQEAARRRVDVSDAELDAELAARARSANLSAAQFEQAMRQSGFDPQTFKTFLRANMAWTQILRSRFRATVNITEQDVAAALTEREAPAEQRTATEFLVQQIIFIVPQGAATGVEAQQRKEAAAFRDAFQGCDQSLQQASGKPGVVVKAPVRREEGQLGADLKAKLAALDVGGVTEPEKVAEGIQLLAICAKEEIAGQTEAAVEARQEITSERGQLLARRYLRDLRSDAVIEYR